MLDFSIRDSKLNEPGICLEFSSLVCLVELIGPFAFWSGSNLGIKCLNFKYYICSVTTQFSRSDYCSGKTTSRIFFPRLDPHCRRKSLRNTLACSPRPAQKLYTLISSTYRKCSTLKELSKRATGVLLFALFQREVPPLCLHVWDRLNDETTLTWFSTLNSSWLLHESSRNSPFVKSPKEGTSKSSPPLMPNQLEQFSSKKHGISHSPTDVNSWLQLPIWPPSGNDPLKSHVPHFFSLYWC